jgi:hypothetical protein
MNENEFDDLAGPSDGALRPESATRLVDEIAASLGEPAGRLTIAAGEDPEMAWLLRDGRRLSWFNLREAERQTGERRTRLVRTFADMVRRYDELRPVIDGLTIGRRYRVEYKNEKIRRTFRTKGVLRAVSEFRHARGVTGAGWTLTLESKPAFGKPVTYRFDTAALTDIRPV